MGKRWRIICLASAGVFVALALVASAGVVVPAERGLYQWVTGEASPGVVAVFRWINYLGDKRVLLPATVLLIFLLPQPLRRRWWLWAGVMVVGAPLLEDLTKMAVGRHRPEGPAMGFPSGHVTAAAAFFVMAAYLAEKSLEHRQARICWACATLIVVLVGIARIVLRAHWPLDTMGGAALGLVCASAAAWWNERSS